MTTIDERIKQVADYCLKNKISVIPIGEDKKPAIKWGACIDTPLDEWDFPGCNIAIVTGHTNGLVVVDCDSQEDWMAWEQNMPPTPVRVKSRRGMHYWYRMPDCYIKSGSHLQMEGMSFHYDIKGSRSYTLMPPSINKGHQYAFWPTAENPTGRFMPINSLPMFDPKWRPEAKQPSGEFDRKEIKDVRAYISKIVATEGQGGDRETYRVCCKLAQSGLSEMEAMAIAVEWNATNARPQWEVKDLIRKLQCAFAEVNHQ